MHLMHAVLCCLLCQHCTGGMNAGRSWAYHVRTDTPSRVPRPCGCAALAGRSVEEELGAEQQRQPGRGFQTRSSFSDLKRSVGEALRRVQSEKPASLSSWLGTNAPGKAQQAPHLESCPERGAHVAIYVCVKAIMCAQ